MAPRKNTDKVLAAARKEVQAQLAVVRDDIARLTAEQHALTHVLTSLDGGNPAVSSAGTVKKDAGSRPARSASSCATRKRSSARRRRRGATKSTAERVEELRGLLADGPKSRSDLAASLKVSPPRVQQLLSELGGAVSSQPDPNQRRGKLWSLNASGKASSVPRRGSRAGAKRTPAKAGTRKAAAKK
jgi:hypothetical protein